MSHDVFTKLVFWLRDCFHGVSSFLGKVCGRVPGLLRTGSPVVLNRVFSKQLSFSGYKNCLRKPFRKPTPTWVKVFSQNKPYLDPWLYTVHILLNIPFMGGQGRIQRWGGWGSSAPPAAGNPMEPPNLLLQIWGRRMREGEARGRRRRKPLPLNLFLDLSLWVGFNLLSTYVLALTWLTIFQRRIPTFSPKTSSRLSSAPNLCM
jgi:hypothetical protein